jgi:serine/threonine-protein kinase
MMLAGSLASPTEQARFGIEAVAVARLNHPNIVRIYEVGEYEGKLFFSLEYAEGNNLEARIGETPQPESEAARLVEVLAAAIHYAHQHGVLHRDLKPSNILLMADGTPKVADFGLAKLLDGSGPTPTEAFIGTPNYMAPEQAGNARESGVPADVYALGAILYKLLTGQPPFQACNLLHTLEQVRNLEPTPTPRHKPWQRTSVAFNSASPSRPGRHPSPPTCCVPCVAASLSSPGERPFFPSCVWG